MTRDKLERCQKLAQTIDRYKRMYKKIYEWKGEGKLRLRCGDFSIAINDDDCGLITEMLRRRIVEMETEFKEL